MIFTVVGSRCRASSGRLLSFRGGVAGGLRAMRCLKRAAAVASWRSRQCRLDANAASHATRLRISRRKRFCACCVPVRRKSSYDDGRLRLRFTDQRVVKVLKRLKPSHRSKNKKIALDL
jgi:hypothetical protein